MTYAVNAQPQTRPQQIVVVAMAIPAVPDTQHGGVGAADPATRFLDDPELA